MISRIKFVSVNVSKCSFFSLLLFLCSCFTLYVDVAMKFVRDGRHQGQKLFLFLPFTLDLQTVLCSFHIEKKEEKNQHHLAHEKYTNRS